MKLETLKTIESVLNATETLHHIHCTKLFLVKTCLIFIGNEKNSATFIFIKIFRKIIFCYCNSLFFPCFAR